MDVETGLNLIDNLSFDKTEKRLSDLAKNIFKETWQGKTSSKIAGFCNCSEPFVKENWSKWWKLLSEELGETVNKSNYKGALERLKLQNRQKSSYIADFYVNRPPIEEICYEEILKDGALIRIKGLKNVGKTWFLEKRIIPKARQENYETVSLSFNSLNDNYLQDMEKLLKWLCNAIKKELELELNLGDYWDEYDPPNANATNYLEKILQMLKGKVLLIALDDVDLIFNNLNIANDFCKLLRNWHDESSRNNRHSELWKQLRLVILHSTEKYAELDINSSPLANVGRDFELNDFNLDQVKEFIKHYQLNWTNSEINDLYELVGGHPYLINIACQEYQNSGITFNQLIQKSCTEEGIFANHLRELLEILEMEKNKDLKTDLIKVIKSKDSILLNPNSAFQLENIGVVKREGNLVNIRCNLYKNYFIFVLNLSI